MSKLISTFALGFLVAIGAGCQSENPGTTPSNTVKAYDFTEVVPPSTLYLPGTIVGIRRTVPNTSLDIICDQASASGPKLPLQNSSSVDAETQRRTSGTFKLDVTALKTLTGDVSIKGVKDVTYTLKNLQIKELSGNAAVAAEKHREPDCVEAVDRATRNGQVLTMVKTVLIADVVYTVNFDASVDLSVEAKQGLIKEIAGSLGVGGAETSASKFTGQGLIWGIRDNANYIAPQKLGFAPESIPDSPVLSAFHPIVVEPSPHQGH